MSFLSTVRLSVKEVAFVKVVKEAYCTRLQTIHFVTWLLQDAL